MLRAAEFTAAMAPPNNPYSNQTNKDTLMKYTQYFTKQIEH